MPTSRIRWYADESVLGLGKLLARERDDVAYPGHPALPAIRPGALDTDWMPIVARRGWVVFHRDRRIRTRPAELEIFRSARRALVAGRVTGVERGAGSLPQTLTRAVRDPFAPGQMRRAVGPPPREDVRVMAERDSGRRPSPRQKPETAPPVCRKGSPRKAPPTTSTLDPFPDKENDRRPARRPDGRPPQDLHVVEAADEDEVRRRLAEDPWARSALFDVDPIQPLELWLDSRG